MQWRGAAILFDCDGVLVDSTAQVLLAWQEWCQLYRLDADVVLPVIHGRRGEDTVASLLPIEQVVRATQDHEAIDLRLADQVVALPGAVELTAQLLQASWAVVTSGSRRLAQARLNAAGITSPPVLVTADDVQRGKPDPEAYLAAAKRLGSRLRTAL